MTTMTAHHHGTERHFGRFGAIVSDFVAAVREAREMNARYEHLTRLSNTELSRLGLSREEIPQAVVNGR
ncbi:DUF1127 domain-containing protein [Aquabacter sp. L1I39]|uniref:DUF1127 domain-containing protein n=1 Tax=Aquabacter sp. L1I39 TaxID=2820278 RepID=UPI001ADAC040|nr:DUF1127 domain-containing protein [Aquabacter sp. L1I39]QTL02255.1 DUF1127 domain-containing protein [Aquabacter sp. L1I39]